MESLTLLITVESDNIKVMRYWPTLVLTNVNTEELEAADSLHRSSIEVDEAMSYSLLFLVVHNQLIGFAGVEMEVVVPSGSSRSSHRGWC